MTLVQNHTANFTPINGHLLSTAMKTEAFR
jgi:hypothetical protein